MGFQGVTFAFQKCFMKFHEVSRNPRGVPEIYKGSRSILGGFEEVPEDFRGVLGCSEKHLAKGPF